MSLITLMGERFSSPQHVANEREWLRPKILPKKIVLGSPFQVLLIIRSIKILKQEKRTSLYHFPDFTPRGIPRQILS